MRRSIAAIAAGPDQFHLIRWVSGHKLDKGAYTLQATPSLGGRTGATQTAAFHILRSAATVGSREMRRHFYIAITLIVAGMLVAAAGASAATIVVTNNGDGSPPLCPSPSSCTLRGAIAAAKPGDTVLLAAGTYTLAGFLPPVEVLSAVTVAGQGPGATVITHDNSGNISLFEVTASGNLTLSGVRLTGGDPSVSTTTGAQGGAISNAGTLSLVNDTLGGNTALGGQGSGATGGEGGAVFNTGTLVVSNTSFINDDALGGAATGATPGLGGQGGAIWTSGSATITGSSFDGGLADAGQASAGGAGGAGRGGAIHQASGTLTVTGSSFGATSGNSATGGAAGGNGTGGTGGLGGAVDLAGGAATLSADAFAQNQATGGTASTDPLLGESGGGLGGAIGAANATLRLSGCTFGSGDVAQYGVGDGAANGQPGTGGFGGAVWAVNATVISSGDSFAGTFASGGEMGAVNDGAGGWGGAMFISSGALHSTGDTFTGDVAGAGGVGGVALDGSPSGGQGGAIYTDATNSTITGASFSGNLAGAGNTTDAGGGQGGAIVFTDGGTMTLSGSTLTGNTAQQGGGKGAAQGGAIDAVAGTLAITQSTLSGNTAANGQGGAIYDAANLVRVLTSTLSGNSARGGGAATDSGASTLVVVNSTVASNTAANEGGGIQQLGGTLDLSSATIDANTAANVGGNVYLQSSTANLHDTLIAGGTTGKGTAPNCDVTPTATVASAGYNLEDQNSCKLTGPGDQVAVSPAPLGQPANNGGPTLTIALLAGSPAIDAGDPAGCTDPLGTLLPTDQRGVARPQNGRCDIGAYEYVPPPAQIGVAGSTTRSTTLQLVPPQDGVLALKPTSFAAQAHGASIARAAAQGTTLSYTDTQAATTAFVVQRPASGIRVGSGSCTAPPRHRPKHAKPCTRYIAVGGFTHADAAGANGFHFSGRIGGRKLGKGSYRLTATPSAGGLTGATLTASFKIVG